MPVVGRRPSVTILPTGETLAIITEAAQYSIPSFNVSAPRNEESYLVQDDIYPLGSRISYSLISKEGVQSFPVPILCLYKDAEKGAQPLNVFPLHNAVGLSVTFDATTLTVHCMWWWNAWTPDYISNTPLPPPPVVSPHASLPPPPPPLQEDLTTDQLPAPPVDYYAAHSVPDPQTPIWLKSLVPTTSPSAFDHTKPFWIAPIPEGYQLDYFNMGEGDGVGDLVMGESKANGSPRLPDTPGARWLMDAVERGLMDFPGPPPAAFGADPTPERDEWERRGGIVAAGEHIRQASRRDEPEFVPGHQVNPYTNEEVPRDLPGVGVKFPETMTWEDHLIIINALKAHFDHANLVNSTRVLMYTKGSIIDGVIFTSIPTKIVVPAAQNDKDDVDYDVVFEGPFWPGEEEETKVSMVLLDFPQVVGVFPVTTNYRTLINPDKVWYPLNDYPDIGVNISDDGFLLDGATSDQFQEAMVDWVMSDPCDPAVELYDLYRYHLDNVSY